MKQRAPRSPRSEGPSPANAAFFEPLAFDPAPVLSRVSTADKYAPLALALAALFLTACHIYYAINSRIPPSTDEAHYMSGALSIADGFRLGTLHDAWQGYVHALGFKAPLVCVPAALFMLVGGGLELPCMLSLSATFAALAYASYKLFRNCVEPAVAATATLLLVTTPLVTGLTHRFYVELLLLLIAVSYLDALTKGTLG